jgi:hypothetical protein
MFMQPWSSTQNRKWPVAAALLAAAVSATCSKASPTAPSGTAPPPPPNSGNVQVAIVPNPVPFSGVPVTDTPECANLPNTWYYDQVFDNTGGTGVTFNARIDTFDEFVVNNLSGLDISISANGTLTIHARWCSENRIAHVAQSTFSGVDSAGQTVTLTTPRIQLLP